MVLTKELAAKGTAMLGAAGTGGTGLYYGGSYLHGAIHRGESLLNTMEREEGSHFTFKVRKKDNDNEEQDLSDSNDISFTKSQPFVVKVTSYRKYNTNTLSHTTSEVEDTSLSCTFKFVVEGSDYGNKTVKQDYKKRIFYQTSNQMLGLFGILNNPLQDYTDDTSDSTKWTAQELTQVKKTFIDNCGKHPTSDKKEIVIKFKKETNGESLVPSETEVFNKWFLSDQQKDKQLHLA